MCLIIFAYRYHPRYQLVLAANRDEFYERPTRALDFWPDHPAIAAGRDLKQMGTWLGVTRSGRLAAVTNYREVGVQSTDAPSRGHLVADFLAGHTQAPRYLEQLKNGGHLYNGFNLILGEPHGLYYYSNRGGPASPVEPGIHGLSNRLLDSDWPKVRNGKAAMDDIMANNKDDIHRESLLDLLQDRYVPPDEHLPDTGVGLQWERVLAPIFITSPGYGTRSSSLLTIDYGGEVDFTEITWQQAREKPRPQEKKHIHFTIEKTATRSSCR